MDKWKVEWGVEKKKEGQGLPLWRSIKSLTMPHSINHSNNRSTQVPDEVTKTYHFTEWYQNHIVRLACRMGKSNLPQEGSSNTAQENDIWTEISVMNMMNMSQPVMGWRQQTRGSIPSNRTSMYRGPDVCVKEHHIFEKPMEVQSRWNELEICIWSSKKRLMLNTKVWETRVHGSGGNHVGDGEARGKQIP